MHRHPGYLSQHRLHPAYLPHRGTRNQKILPDRDKYSEHYFTDASEYTVALRLSKKQYLHFIESHFDHETSASLADQLKANILEEFQSTLEEALDKQVSKNQKFQKFKRVPAFFEVAMATFGFNYKTQISELKKRKKFERAEDLQGVLKLNAQMKKRAQKFLDEPDLRELSIRPIRVFVTFKNL
eukprot:CAMPEP_0170504614 /NCGR_PEP_ID=MMETSP0208-20121228/48418_1 /TAXON_ID=197538 /ORGANISM="Strombidium inclinatum, Strain S3" /LENGTH=183 /DNA_ID=CAMNT_0010784971 /DNA_START=529 /DNA_END=1081 /DNA_ORIENTATION=-